MAESTTSEHRPDFIDNPPYCVCGGEEVYFEDTTPPGYGCEVDGKPFAATLDRLGFHIHPQAVIEVLESRDDLFDQLSNREVVRVERWQHQAQRRGRRG
jgi:hypothetical protein